MTLRGWAACLGCDGLREGARRLCPPPGVQSWVLRLCKGKERKGTESVRASKSGGGMGGTIPVQTCARGLCAGSAAALCQHRGSLLSSAAASQCVPAPLGSPLPADPHSPALGQHNPTDCLFSGRTDGVPVSAPVEMGPAALPGRDPLCWTPGMTCPGGVLPRDLSAILSVTISAAELASGTGDTATGSGVGGAGGCVWSWSEATPLGLSWALGVGISSSKHVLVAPLSFGLTSPVCRWASTKQIPQRRPQRWEGGTGSCPPQISHDSSSCPLVLLRCWAGRRQNHRITESQNSRGWQGPLWVI